MASFLDENGVVYLWSKIKGLFNQAVKGLSISGTTLTYTKGDNSTGTVTIPQKTYNNFTGATSSNDGSSGLVPAPSKGKQGSFLKGDGTWSIPTNTTYNAFGGATASAVGSSGLVPAPPAGLPKVLLNNGAWEKLTINIDDASNGNDKVISLSTASQINYDAITLPSFTGTKSGLVPKSNNSDMVLYGDGTWGEAVESISGSVSTNNDGYVIGILVNNGTEYKSTKIPLATDTSLGFLSKELHAKLNALPSSATIESTYAKKTDLSGLYKYKGSVADESKLPTTNRTSGDVYNIVAASQYGGAGTNVAWDGSKWDALGGTFVINSITNARLDAICV